MNRNLNFSYSRKVIIIGIVEVAAFFIDLVFYFLSRNPVEEFYTLLVLGTLIELILFQVLYHVIYESFYKNSFKDKVSTILQILLLTIILASSTSTTIRYYKDIPYVINGQYKVIVGKCSYYYVNLNRTPHIDITIGGVDFIVDIEYENSIKKDAIYKVEYLPNSKLIINMHREELSNN